ncbi:MAG: hypothetical protein JST37_02390 [Bacteroidetes bacterium]|nr:hypothetical protein [Bacteroidota bacterium]MBS1980259.1 hypothetical protein [Bacteroidota bacterium]
MKHTFILLSGISVLAVLTFSGCSKSGGGETTQDKQFGLLSKTWTVSSVTLGGTDVTSSNGWNWTNFTLTITGTTGNYSYTCANRPSIPGPWPTSGTWTFGTDPTTQIVRDTGANLLNMTYVINASASTLQLSFNFTGTGYTRVNNTTGQWVFNLKNP